MSSTLVIFCSGNGTPWYQSSSAKSGDLTINPVGKGKGTKPKPTKTRASAKSGPEVLYPIFSEMAVLTSDPFWRTSFEEMAVGKCHRGFRFENETLVYKVRNRVQTCSLVGVSPYQAVEIIQTFMRTTAGIMSTNDIETRNRQLKQIMAMSSETTIESWGKIRSSQHRTILIANYVASVGEHFGLTEEEEERLDGVIRLGIILKHFDSSTIHVANSSIVQIDGLYRKPDGSFAIETSIAPEKIRPVRKSHSEDSPPTGESPSGEHDDGEDETIDPQIGINIRKRWAKFLDSLTKKCSFETQVIHVVAPPMAPEERDCEVIPGSIEYYS